MGIRVAAFADIHFRGEARGRLRPFLEAASEAADVILVAGDLTAAGRVSEAAGFAEECANLGAPVITVLGNHEHNRQKASEIRRVLRRKGISVLEGQAVTVETLAGTVGVAGCKGFVGGFAGENIHDFGEMPLRRLIYDSRKEANSLEKALASLTCENKIAMTHYAPIKGTLLGEPPAIHTMMGSGYLEGAMNGQGVALAIHGHAHSGTYAGETSEGVPVRNVSLRVLGCPYVLFEVEGGKMLSESSPAPDVSLGKAFLGRPDWERIDGLPKEDLARMERLNRTIGSKALDDMTGAGPERTMRLAFISAACDGVFSGWGEEDVRDWFEAKRLELGGVSVSGALKGDWFPEGEAAVAVKGLAGRARDSSLGV